jgi:hypothetical protein
MKAGSGNQQEVRSEWHILQLELTLTVGDGLNLPARERVPERNVRLGDPGATGVGHSPEHRSGLDLRGGSHSHAQHSANQKSVFDHAACPLPKTFGHCWRPDIRAMRLPV